MYYILTYKIRFLYRMPPSDRPEKEDAWNEIPLSQKNSWYVEKLPRHTQFEYSVLHQTIHRWQFRRNTYHFNVIVRTITNKKHKQFPPLNKLKTNYPPLTSITWKQKRKPIRLKTRSAAIYQLKSTSFFLQHTFTFYSLSPISLLNRYISHKYFSTKNSWKHHGYTYTQTYKKQIFIQLLKL